VNRPSIAPRRHDPYWDLDGTGARQQRNKQRLNKLAAWFAVVLVLAAVATQLPAIDPEYLTHGAGRPILAAALMAILAAAALLALARIRYVSRN